MTIIKKHSTESSFWGVISVLSEDILAKTWVLLEKRSWHRKCHLSFIYNLKTTPESKVPLYSSSTQTTGSFVSQSPLVMPWFLPLEMNFSIKFPPWLNRQIYLATLAELANDTNESMIPMIPMILQPSHRRWHQKLFSLVMTVCRVKIKKLYLGSVWVPRDGMNALGSSRSHIIGGIHKLDCS